MGQVWVGGAARDFIKDRNKMLSPPACTTSVTATRTQAMRISQTMVRVDAIVMGVADAGASAPEPSAHFRGPPLASSTTGMVPAKS